MRIQEGQGLFGVLPCQIFLPIFQIGIGKIIVRVGRVRISEEVELEDFDCRLRITFAQMARGYNVDRNFRPQLRFGIFLPRLCQLPRGLRNSVGRLDLIEDYRRYRPARVPAF